VTGHQQTDSQPDLERRLTELCAEACGLPSEQLNPQRRFLEYGLDSVRALELVSAVEESFDIDIEDEMASRLKTLADLIGCVRALTRAQEHQP
jgi:acyl carrier protein